MFKKIGLTTASITLPVLMITGCHKNTDHQAIHSTTTSSLDADQVCGKLKTVFGTSQAPNNSTFNSHIIRCMLFYNTNVVVVSRVTEKPSNIVSQENYHGYTLLKSETQAFDVHLITYTVNNSNKWMIQVLPSKNDPGFDIIEKAVDSLPQ